MNASLTPMILVVEDDEVIREMLRLTLEFEGYRVATAEDGQKALDLLERSSSPDLIVLDLMMPVMDGWAFAAAVAADARFRSIPIVVVTAYAEKASSIRNAAAVLKKPINAEALLEQVRIHGGESELSHGIPA